MKHSEGAGNGGSKFLRGVTVGAVLGSVMAYYLASDPETKEKLKKEGKILGEKVADQLIDLSSRAKNQYENYQQNKKMTEDNDGTIYTIKDDIVISSDDADDILDEIDERVNDYIDEDRG